MRGSAGTPRLTPPAPRQPAPSRPAAAKPVPEPPYGHVPDLDTSVDPDPVRTPGLEPGGGVAPGDTPPESGQTSGLSHRERTPARRLQTAAIIILFVIVLLSLAFLVSQVMGWTTLV
ncbi:hypothetical protein GCM10022243_55940 [Saccharothrix violaceirubra]